MSFVYNFINQWLGDLAGVMISFTGLLICVLAAGAFWEQRLRYCSVIGCFSVGFIAFIYPYLAPYSGAIQSMSKSAAALATLAAVALLTVTGFVLRGRRSKSVVEYVLGRSGGRFTVVDIREKRSIRGTIIGVPVIVLLASAAILGVGLSAPQVMIGDEVTHFYMLANQAKDLSIPNFWAEIPMAAGDAEIRRYPHSFFWHYIGAVFYSLSGGSFAAIQLYQTFFYIQFLVVAYLLAKDRGGVESRAALLYVVVLASLPLSLIFSVAFYQDVPMTAQVLTAFYFLRRQRWLLAALFMGLAIGMKVTASLFFPIFFLLVLVWQIRRDGWLKATVVLLCTCAIVLGTTWFIGKAIVKHGKSEFYPQAKLEKILKKGNEALEAHFPRLSRLTGIDNINTELSARPTAAPAVENKPPIIANHPGDLRIKVNFLIYGGGVMWLVTLCGLAGMMSRGSRSGAAGTSSLWLYLVGGTYTILTAWFAKTSPDARFFLPALPFLLLPLVEKAVHLPKPKILISLVIAIAFLQGSYVLQKTYKLRALTSEIQQGIQYLQDNPPSGRIFMYPEGNYRFFPAQHEWYLGYRLREFWHADNDGRLKLLRKYKVRLLVIKKYLIAPVDEKITNLGVYPDYFVKDISHDPKFEKVFENRQLLIFKVPLLPDSTE